MPILRLLLLPFRAPMLLVLLLVTAYLGFNWSNLAPKPWPCPGCRATAKM